MRTFGIMYQYMMMYCMENSLYWLNRAIQEAENVDSALLRRCRAQKMRVLSLIGRNEESITVQLEMMKSDPDNLEAWVLLVIAYMHAKEYQKALDWAVKGIEKYPEEWELYIHASDSCRHLERYEEAMEYAVAALRIHPDYVDAKYSMAWCYEKMGKAKDAYSMYLEIASDLRRNGFVIEADSELHHAKALMEHFSQA